ncbi:hypothetical protein L1887_00986 [Cichorium endivia]|nr:hypothetical protein L1887_00986 [Cichorium endivia]
MMHIQRMSPALGEMLLENLKGDIPLVIFRPTIITSTYKEPFPGWIEGIKTVDSMIVSYGKGRLTCFPGDPESVYDVKCAYQYFTQYPWTDQKDGKPVIVAECRGLRKGERLRAFEESVLSMSPSPPLSNASPQYLGFRFREDEEMVVEDDVNGGGGIETDGEN